MERVVKPRLTGLARPVMHPLNSITRLKTTFCKDPTYYPVMLLPFPMGKQDSLQYVPTRFDLKSDSNIENGLEARLTKVQRDAEGVVEPQSAALRKLADFCRQEFHPKFRKTEKVSFEVFMQRRGYTGAKKERYQRAYQEYLDHGGLREKDSYISAFIKCENQPAKVAQAKQPRIVQSRNYSFALTFGMFLEEIEGQMYGYNGIGVGVRPTSTFGKGHCPLKRGRTIELKMKQFRKPEVVMFDLTGFDSTIKAGLLRIAHELYRHCNDAAEFQQLMRWQLRTRGFAGDFTYTIGTGGRCSGDFDTSLGNAYIMAAALAHYCHERKIAKWDMYCDGDDTLLFIEEGTLNHDDITSFYRDLGMILRVEGVAHTMEEINWCQCTPVFVRGKYRMIPNYRKKISHLLSSPKMCGGYLKSLALNEKLVSNGVPILASFASLLDRSSEGYAPGILDDSLQYSYKNSLKSYGDCPRRDPVEISYETRVSFAKAFGISIEEQVRQEILLDHTRLDVASIDSEVQKWNSVVHPDFGAVT